MIKVIQARSVCFIQRSSPMPFKPVAGDLPNELVSLGAGVGAAYRDEATIGSDGDVLEPAVEVGRLIPLPLRTGRREPACRLTATEDRV